MWVSIPAAPKNANEVGASAWGWENPPRILRRASRARSVLLLGARVIFEPDQTPYDLRWRMLGTDVRVSPWFWLMSVFLGAPLLEEGLAGFPYLLVWIACVFISILVHEFGHVLAGRAFGTQGHIVLYSFGGLAIGSSNLSNRWQRVAVYLAGPGAGFVLLACVLPVYLIGHAQPEVRRDWPHLFWVAISSLWYINLYWGILNLMPVYPLDGGQVSRDTFDWLMPGGQGLRVAFGLSMGIAILLAVLALVFSQMFTAIMFGLLAVYSFQMFQQQTARGGGHSSDDRAPWEQDPDAWKRGGGNRW